MQKALICGVALFVGVFSVLGQNGVKEGDYFLLLKGEYSISLNMYENDNIIEKATFSLPTESVYATDNERRVAILNTIDNAIDLHDIQTQKTIKLSIPYDINTTCILLNDENLFIGGSMGEEILVQYNFKNEKWYSLEIPEVAAVWGKPVDDLVISNKYLIAVDNLILPKFILFYRLNSIGKLSYSHFRILKSNSTYEHIHQARITSKYLGLNSTTVNYGNYFEHITVYADLNLKRSFAVSSKFMYSGTNFTDFLIFEDKLFIANRIKGLGVLDIEDSFFEESDDEMGGLNKQIDENKIQYKLYENEEIIQLTKIPHESKIILSIKNRQNIVRYEIIEVS